eukprot:TRINITY_DN11792_c0_g2_i1.p1 TRINITY_DN11792_c0_g2~~TRINITY_DN11792_c0_g2_i1.p1  ORF type:complete len:1946 (+),score=593.51 TRINITY_DN11792_c0_g2_i1:1-5838(+)
MADKAIEIPTAGASLDPVETTTASVSSAPPTARPGQRLTPSLAESDAALTDTILPSQQGDSEGQLAEDDNQPDVHESESLAEAEAIAKGVVDDHSNSNDDARNVSTPVDQLASAEMKSAGEPVEAYVETGDLAADDEGSASSPKEDTEQSDLADQPADQPVDDAEGRNESADSNGKKLGQSEGDSMVTSRAESEGDATSMAHDDTISDSQAAEVMPAKSDAAESCDSGEEAQKGSELVLDEVEQQPNGDQLPSDADHAPGSTSFDEKGTPIDTGLVFIEDDGQSTADCKGLASNTLALTHSFGTELTRHRNVYVVNGNTLAMIAGNYITFRNLSTGKLSYLRSHSGRGVGALAVHPAGNWLAVGEKGGDPVINIYHWPSLRLYKVLRNGTTSGYADLSFDPAGDMLASVGTSPDYLLTVWDWQQATVTLRTKAFSSDVWRVSFNPHLKGDLTTSGQGHIRFWKMAATFTGLKLQGQIGKFGRTELSDISGYAELPDGKVLSGSEWGNLLLWEGGFIKCQLAMPGDKPCHAGSIDCVIELESGDFATAGADGFIRVWDFESVDGADRPHDSPYFILKPVLERRVSPTTHIKSMALTSLSGEEEGVPSVYIAQDANGCVWQVDLSPLPTTKPPSVVSRFHAGPVAGVAASPSASWAVSAGHDSTVVLYDYLTNARLDVFAPELAHPATAAAWLPLSADPSGRVVAVGYGNGVVRLFAITAEQKLSLIQIVKPHTQAVSHLSVSPDGNRVATVDESGCIFLFQLAAGLQLKPVGFIPLASPTRCIHWHSDSHRLLAAQADGVVLEYAVPGLKDVDTHHTFRLAVEPSRTYRFESMLHLLEPKPSKVKASVDDHTDDDQSSKQTDVDERPVEEEDELIPTPSICQVWYGEDETLELLVDGPNAGYKYTCSWDMPQPMRADPLHNTCKVRPTTRAVTPDGDYVVFGFEDGRVLAHSLADWSNSLDLGVHDCDAGAVTGVVSSFDGTRLLTSGMDGNVFVFASSWSADTQPMDNQAGPAVDWPTVADHTDDKVYSLEEEREKAERDRAMMTAEQRKARVKEQIANLRTEFEAIASANARLPLPEQLPAAAFEMDPQFRRDMAARKQAALDRVRRELNWELERNKIAHAKLREYFLAVMDQPRFVVKGIHRAEHVASFRVPKLSQRFKRHSEQLFQTLDVLNRFSDRKLSGTMRHSIAHSVLSDSASEANEGDIGQTEELLNQELANTTGTTARERKEREMLKTKVRQQRRRQIQARIDAHAERKPEPDKMDPQDEEMLLEMSQNLGDYKLKTSPDYVVPASERINTSIKRRQLLILRQRIIDAKKLFNRNVTTLRQRKLTAKAKLEVILTHLQRVQQRLGEPLADLPTAPELDDDEMPERVNDYTSESLLAFKQEYALQLDQEREAAAKAQGGGFGGFSGFGAGGNSGTADGPMDFSNPLATLKAAERAKLEQLLATQGEGAAHAQAKLYFERQRLASKYKEVVDHFDRQLLVLAQAKQDVSLRLKFAEYKHVLYYQELVHLKVFDIREGELELKRGKKKQDLSDCRRSYKTASANCSSKRKTLAKLTADEKAVHTDFSRLLNDGHPHAKFLTKMFKRKVKRRGSTYNSDEESDSDSEYESSEEEDSDMEDFDDSVCPSGCSEELYQRVFDLRERRLDLEEAIAQEKKSLDLLQKEADSAERKEGQLKAAVAAADKDIAVFQAEKQAKLNELQVSVPLTLKQVYHTENGSLPRSMENSIVFTKAALTQLQDTIDRLEEAKATHREEFKEIKTAQGQLKHVVYQKHQRNAEARDKLKQLQELKFGRVVDLEEMEGSGVNSRAENLKEEEADLIKQHAREQRKLDALLLATQEELNQVVNEHTTRLADLNDLRRDNKVLERQLDAADKLINTQAADAQATQQVEEAMRLQQVAALQQEEIAALRDEVRRLSRKTGFVAPPQRQRSSVPALPPL